MRSDDKKILKETCKTGEDGAKSYGIAFFESHHCDEGGQIACAALYNSGAKGGSEIQATDPIPVQTSLL